MKQRRSLSSPDPFFRIRADFERWRRHRVSGDRIPARLWAAAVDLARRHGVSKTSSALRLDYYVLKNRLESDAPSPRQSKSLARSCADVRSCGGFVEIPLEIQQAPSAPECVLVLEVADGSRLRVELRGVAASIAGIDALARSLFAGAQAPTHRT